jgi:predicted nucleic acid-binding protein
VAVVVDTSVLIAIERAQERGRPRPALPTAFGYMSAVTFSELLVGAWKAPTHAIAVRRRRFAEEITGDIPVIDIDAGVARCHAALVASLARGITLDCQDLWIAATAIAHGYTIYTLNIRDFVRMPGVALHPQSFA